QADRENSWPDAEGCSMRAGDRAPELNHDKRWAGRHVCFGVSSARDRTEVVLRNRVSAHLAKKVGKGRRSAYTRAVGLALILAAGGGCVSKEVHEATLKDLQDARTDSSQKGVRIEALQREVGELGHQLQALEAKLSDASTAQADLDKKIEDLLVLNAELASR